MPRSRCCSKSWSSSPCLDGELALDLLGCPALLELLPDLPTRRSCEMAADRVVALLGDPFELRVGVAGLFGLVRAARIEATAGGRRDQARRAPGNRHERLVARAVEPRNR